MTATTPDPEPRSDAASARFIDGVEIVAVEQAVGPHPANPEELVPYKNIAKALLADGSEQFLCDGVDQCDFHSATLRSVVSHRRVHRSGGQVASYYSTDALKMVIREASLARRTGSRKWAQMAADALTARGMKTTHGKEWTASSVSHLYRKFHDTVKVRLPGPGRPVGVKNGEGKDAVAARERVAKLGGHPTLLEEARAIREFVEHALVAATNLVSFVEAGRYEATVDPALAAKAAKWDQMQALMGN